MTVSKRIRKYGKKALDLLANQSGSCIIDTYRNEALENGYRFIEVPGKQVASDAFADTIYKEPGRAGLIRIPDMGNPGKDTDVKEYLGAHELGVEAEYGKVMDQRTHSLREKDCLIGLKNRGRITAFLTGLGMHAYRLMSKNKEERDSFKEIKPWIADQYKAHREDLKEWALPRLQKIFGLPEFQEKRLYSLEKDLFKDMAADDYGYKEAANG